MIGNKTSAPVIGNPYVKLDRNRPRNMVFYGRVSTEHEAQLSALENQIQWYDDQAKYHPNWNVLDKYIDEGITGTQAKKRPAFLRMLEDARAGKFDLIVTREVCRFARNTVDTLVTTRELKNMGIEVYFVEDNIWTLDGDGELRLTIMATLAQEESRKVSERVKAGQQISRENGTIYGMGNILGYDLVDGKYVINPDQAKTVRMIYDMYLTDGIGCMKIANELTRQGRKNSSGTVKWHASYVSRVLRNPTYLGMMAYGKSYSNNYLDQKRIQNRDIDSYMYVKCDFEPLITEEEYRKSLELHRRRTMESPATDGLRHGFQENKDVWGSRLICKCGSKFRKNVNHRNKNNITYGYLCYSIVNTGSVKKMLELGADPTGHCDMPMVTDWKMEMMGSVIFRHVWGDTKPIIEKACSLIRSCYKEESRAPVVRTDPSAEIDRLMKKRAKLVELYTDECISREEFTEQRNRIDQEIKELKKQQETAVPEETPIPVNEERWKTIRSELNEMLDFSAELIDRDVYKKFISRIQVVDKTHYIWYLNLDDKSPEEIRMLADGRKSDPIIIILDEDPQNDPTGADGDEPSAPLHIPFKMLEKALKKGPESSGEAMFAYPLELRHRLLLRRTRNRIPLQQQRPRCFGTGGFCRRGIVPPASSAGRRKGSETMIGPARQKSAPRVFSRGAVVCSGIRSPQTDLSAVYGISLFSLGNPRRAEDRDEDDEAAADHRAAAGLRGLSGLVVGRGRLRRGFFGLGLFCRRFFRLGFFCLGLLSLRFFRSGFFRLRLFRRTLSRARLAVELDFRHVAVVQPVDVAEHLVAVVVLEVGHDVVLGLGRRRLVGFPKGFPLFAVVRAFDGRAREAIKPAGAGQDRHFFEDVGFVEFHAAEAVADAERIEEGRRLAVERGCRAGSCRAVPAGLVADDLAHHEVAGFTGCR
ncbi:MAG: recombinase family protein, partial [Clostridiales bacterium]|nr:recombinase family protein [Clostridiales bacterium]